MSAFGKPDETNRLKHAPSQKPVVTIDELIIHVF